MAFGKNKDEVFQRISTVTQTEEQPKKNKKKSKAAEAETAPAPDTSMWKSSVNSSSSVQHFAASEPSATPAKSDAPKSAESAASDSVREVGTRAADTRPEIGYTMSTRDEDVTGGLYSDSGRTVTMAMRLLSYILFICGPLYFVGKVFGLIGLEADEITTGLAVSTVIDGVIGCVLLVGAGFIVIALIKILQNLMALQKKKMK